MAPPGTAGTSGSDPLGPCRARRITRDPPPGEGWRCASPAWNASSGQGLRRTEDADAETGARTVDGGLQAVGQGGRPRHGNCRGGCGRGDRRPATAALLASRRTLSGLALGGTGLVTARIVLLGRARGLLGAADVRAREGALRSGDRGRRGDHQAQQCWDGPRHVRKDATMGSRRTPTAPRSPQVARLPGEGLAAILRAMRTTALARLLATAALLSLGLSWAGCEASGPPAGQIEPEPVAAEAPPAEVAPAPAAPSPTPTAAPTADGAKPATGAGSGCCGSSACAQAAAAAGGGEGCGCRRGLPPEVAAQVNCGG